MNITFPKRKKYNTHVFDDINPTLFIPENVKKEINYLNSKSPDKEWSGIMFYTVDEGTLSNPDKMKLTAKGILLKDIGTAGSTSYSFGTDVIEYWDMKAKELGCDSTELYATWKIAHIHSHNNMGVTPSTTDTEEIEDNINNHIMYLTPIVNNRLNISCYLSVYAELETSYKIKNLDNNTLQYKNEKTDGIFKYKVNVVWEKEHHDIDDWFVNKFKEIELQNNKRHTPPIALLSKRNTNYKKTEDAFKKYKNEELTNYFNHDFDEYSNFDDLNWDDEMDIVMLIETLLYGLPDNVVEDIENIEDALDFIINMKPNNQLINNYINTYFKDVKRKFESVYSSYGFEITNKSITLQINNYIDILQDIKDHDLTNKVIHIFEQLRTSYK